MDFLQGLEGVCGGSARCFVSIRRDLVARLREFGLLDDCVYQLRVADHLPKVGAFRFVFPFEDGLEATTRPGANALDLHDHLRLRAQPQRRVPQGCRVPGDRLERISLVCLYGELRKVFRRGGVGRCPSRGGQRPAQEHPHKSQPLRSSISSLRHGLAPSVSGTFHGSLDAAARGLIHANRPNLVSQFGKQHVAPRGWPLLRRGASAQGGLPGRRAGSPGPEAPWDPCADVHRRRGGQGRPPPMPVRRTCATSGKPSGAFSGGLRPRGGVRLRPRSRARQALGGSTPRGARHPAPAPGPPSNRCRSCRSSSRR